MLSAWPQKAASLGPAWYVHLSVLFFCFVFLTHLAPYLSLHSLFGPWGCWPSLECLFWLWLGIPLGTWLLVSPVCTLHHNLQQYRPHSSDPVQPRGRGHPFASPTWPRRAIAEEKSIIESHLLPLHCCSEEEESDLLELIPCPVWINNTHLTLKLIS